MRTRCSISIAWRRACGPLSFRWRCSTSATWSPTGNAGLSEVIGSWKIIASWSPRRSRIRAGGNLSRSSPSKSTSPPAMRPGGCGTRPMMESAVTLLPQPDSPTMPRVRPRSRRKSTPSTARTWPRSPSKAVRSPRTSSRASVACNLLFDDGPVEDAPWARLARAAAHERNEALVRLLVKAPELGERLGVIVDADVELGIRLGGVDPQRRRFLAALIAAGGLTGLERGDQPFGERTARFCVGARRFADHPLVREHVAGDRIAVAGDRAAPFDALRAGVLPDASGRVDDVELAVVPTIVRGRRPFHRLGRRQARAQQLEATRSVVRVDERLGRERADAALGMRTERARREEPRGDRDSEGAARGISSDDRPCHAAR